MRDPVALTWNVIPSRESAGMDDRAPRLRAGARVRCPHCRRWHQVFSAHTEGTPYTRAMMYFECRGGRYYAGQEGQTSRHPTRAHDD
jgi:hypothetical protein